MQITQVYELVNQSTKEILGESVILNEDLSNVVDVGDAVFNANAMDKYVKSLINHIGKVVFVNRTYQGSAPSVMMDSWEFGSVLQKVNTGLLEATENETWELQDGQSYDPNIFYKPTVQAKFFNKRITFEVPISITERQVKMSFSNATQLNGFVSMLYTSVENTLTVKIDNLIMKTINNFTAETLHNDYSDGKYSESSGGKAINLLYLYNHGPNSGKTPITKADAIYNKEFIRFSAFIMKLTASRMSKMSKLFNIGEQPRFTPYDMMHIVLLEDFKSSADIYLQSDTFHNEFVKLPNSEGVPFWQGSGQNYEFTDVSKIDVKTSLNNTITIDGVLGVIFDRWALGVSNIDKRTTSNFNGKAEFMNLWHKYDAGYFNDFNENFVVFFIA